MSATTSNVIASWEAPAWAESSTRDEDMIHYCCSLGVIHPEDGYDPVLVDVVQTDLLNPGLDRTTMTRDPAQVRVFGVRLSAVEAADLGHRLISAAGLIQDQPQ